MDLVVNMVNIEGGFAEVGAGTWLMGHGQPAAFSGKAIRRRRTGWRVRDRAALDLVETTAVAKCADSSRPFLTHIPCAASIYAVSCKVLIAPASARKDALTVKAIPLSAQRALCATEFTQPSEDGSSAGAPESSSSSGSAWVVMATAGRTARIQVADGDTLSVRPDAVVAWTGKAPTGFCPKLGLLDILLPRGPKDLLFTFYGPGIVWIEGSSDPRLQSRVARQFQGRPYGF